MNFRLLLLVSLLATRAMAQPGNWSADTLRHRAQRALKAHQYAISGQLFSQQAAALTWQSAQADAHYQAAGAYAQAGDAPAALAQLQAAYRRGWCDTDELRQDPNLISLRELPAFQQLARCMARDRARQRDPDRAQLVTTDITHFWQASDRAARDTAHRRQIYQRDYFGRATVGLQDYYESRIFSLPKFVRNLNQKPAFYRAIRPIAGPSSAQVAQIRAGFRRLKELYPDAYFPNVYFVIGRYAAVGTVSRNGMLLSADMLAGAPPVPTEELSEWERASLTPAADLPAVVAHEHIHLLQHPSPDHSLLRGAIEEGMADFLAALTTQRPLHARQHAYGRQHEAALWAAFCQEMAGDNWDNWLFNSEQEAAGRPGDLGYFIGFRICEAYYEQMADKKRAVRDLLHITDYPAFLAQSHYAERLAAQPSKR